MQIKLYRFDHEPDNHFYGDAVDAALDDVVGGVENWSSPKNDTSQKPEATIINNEVKITLHEDGPLIEFGKFAIENTDVITGYVQTLAGVVSAWVAVRAERRARAAENRLHLYRSEVQFSHGRWSAAYDGDLEPKDLAQCARRFARMARRPKKNKE